jgi:hypothetical protein
MILAFADETGDVKRDDYFGLCCAVINSNFYRQIKESFQSILRKNGWNPEIEFKGSYLFSASRGDTNISVDQRIKIASEILRLNSSSQNARMKFAYLRIQECKSPRDYYLRYLPRLLEKILPPAKKKGGKDILSLQCDYRDDISSRDIREAVKEVLERRKYTLLEDVVLSRSGFHTVGILYADIVGYLSSRIDMFIADSDLFSDMPLEQWEKDGRYRKFRSSTDLLQLVKKFNRYEVKVKQHRGS